MTWSFQIDNLVVSWKYGQQRGSFLVDRSLDFHTLSKEEQVKIAIGLTGIVPEPEVRTKRAD